MEPNNKTTSLEDLKAELAKFRDDRNWAQFHKPKDLAMAINIEAGELLEQFLWKSDSEIAKLLMDNVKRSAVIEEMADVIITAINFANVLNVDITDAVLKKVEKNAKKYPVEKAKGSAKKYSEL